MNTAYKYLIAGDGSIMFIFPVVLERFGHRSISLSHAIIGDQQYLTIGDGMYVPIDEELILAFEGIESILVGESGPYDFKVRYVGKISFDPVLRGKLIAYGEMMGKMAGQQGDKDRSKPRSLQEQRLAS